MHFLCGHNYWAFQYFCLGCSILFPSRFERSLLLIVLTSAYIYGLYSYFCGSWLLAGTWNFIGHPHWPPSLLLLRDFSVLLFLALAFDFLRQAVIDYYVFT